MSGVYGNPVFDPENVCTQCEQNNLLLAFHGTLVY